VPWTSGELLHRPGRDALDNRSIASNELVLIASEALAW
jgi:hypothetical protein